jgi:hypothetical protein
MKRFALLLALALLATGAIASSAMAANLVTNGGFESGSIAPATTDYTLITAVGHSTMWSPSTYAIGANPYSYHAGWQSFGPQAGSYMMIINASQYANTLVWGQTVPVVPYTGYQWDVWVRASDTPNPAELRFSVNGEEILTTPSPVIVSSTTTWTKVSGMWVAPEGVTSASLRIVDATHQYSGDDYCIDSITFSDVFSNLGKATGGIKFMAGSTEVQLNFVAMASAEGAKGIVKYSASNGNEFMGRVTAYRQSGDVACFVGTVTKSNNASWGYFYVAVEDNGEGSASEPDEGVRVLAGNAPYTPDLSLATGSYDAFTGNVQIH